VPNIVFLKVLILFVAFISCFCLLDVFPTYTNETNKKHKYLSIYYFIASQSKNNSCTAKTIPAPIPTTIIPIRQSIYRTRTKANRTNETANRAGEF